MRLRRDGTRKQNFIHTPHSAPGAGHSLIQMLSLLSPSARCHAGRPSGALSNPAVSRKSEKFSLCKPHRVLSNPAVSGRREPGESPRPESGTQGLSVYSPQPQCVMTACPRNSLSQRA
jgi:hypothetical protein